MKYQIPINLGIACLFYLIGSQFQAGKIMDLEFKVKQFTKTNADLAAESYYYSGELIKANQVIKNSQQLLSQIVAINKDQISTNTQNLVFATENRSNVVFVYTNVVFMQQK